MNIATIICGGPFGMFGHGTEEDQKNLNIPVNFEELTDAVKTGLENFQKYSWESNNGKMVEVDDGELASLKFQSSDKTYSYYPIFALLSGFLMSAGETNMEQIYKGWRFARQKKYFNL